MFHNVLEISNVKMVPKADFMPVFASLRLFLTKLWQLFCQKKISLITWENTHKGIVLSVFFENGFLKYQKIHTGKNTYRWSPRMHFLILYKITFQRKTLITMAVSIPLCVISHVITEILFIASLWTIWERQKMARSQFLGPYWHLIFI